MHNTTCSMHPCTHTQTHTYTTRRPFSSTVFSIAPWVQCPASWAQCPTSWAQYPAPWAQYLAPWAQYPAAWAQYAAPWVQCPAPWAQCPASWAQCPASWAQCPASWAQCPAPTGIPLVAATVTLRCPVLNAPHGPRLGEPQIVAYRFRLLLASGPQLRSACVANKMMHGAHNATYTYRAHASHRRGRGGGGGGAALSPSLKGGGGLLPVPLPLLHVPTNHQLNSKKKLHHHRSSPD